MDCWNNITIYIEETYDNDIDKDRVIYIKEEFNVILEFPKIDNTEQDRILTDIKSILKKELLKQIGYNGIIKEE